MPPPVRMVEIPKSDGGKRILGIPTVSDRVAQAVVAKELEAVIEPIFHKDSYGYRPSKSAHDAIAQARQQCWKNDWVLGVDIEDFFNKLDHKLLMKAVSHHIKDGWVLLYIERWLKAPTQHVDGRIEDRKSGVPQGGVISPLLANLYLHYAFDLWMKRKYPNLTFERYADDIVIHLHSEEQAQEIKSTIIVRFKECKLSIHPEKSNIIYCKDKHRTGKYEKCKFTFLGYEFKPSRSKSQYGVFCNYAAGISPKATKELCNKIRKWKLHRRTTMTLEDIADQVNPIIRGWIEYYGKYRKMDMRKVFKVLNNRLYKWTKKKYKSFRANDRAARRWLTEQAKQSPNLFIHWKSGFNIE